MKRQADERLAKMKVDATNHIHAINENAAILATEVRQAMTEDLSTTSNFNETDGVPLSSSLTATQLRDSDTDADLFAGWDDFSDDTSELKTMESIDATSLPVTTSPSAAPAVAAKSAPMGSSHPAITNPLPPELSLPLSVAVAPVTGEAVEPRLVSSPETNLLDLLDLSGPLEVSERADDTRCGPVETVSSSSPPRSPRQQIPASGKILEDGCDLVGGMTTDQLGDKHFEELRIRAEQAETKLQELAAREIAAREEAARDQSFWLRARRATSNIIVG